MPFGKASRNIIIINFQQRIQHTAASGANVSFEAEVETEACLGEGVSEEAFLLPLSKIDAHRAKWACPARLLAFLRRR